jgi:hypothetical protein
VYSRLFGNRLPVFSPDSLLAQTDEVIDPALQPTHNGKTERFIQSWLREWA